MSWDWAHGDVYWLVLPKWLCRTSYLKNGTPWFSQSVSWWDTSGIHIAFALTLKAPSCGKLNPFTKMEKVTCHFLFILENARFLTLIYSKYYIVVSTTCKAIWRGSSLAQLSFTEKLALWDLWCQFNSQEVKGNAGSESYWNPDN